MTLSFVSLCESCRWKRDVISGKGSRFLLCERALQDAYYPKYPAQPRLHCAGYEERKDSASSGDGAS